ncbi:AMY [Mytilus edulis]|uniref:alpha-amylase n=1 Tax=Mytilus edulis TaxID=6550 RepID=A0A8S3TL40_MYTED|nr:AMY [Mytilus edulis]
MLQQHFKFHKATIKTQDEYRDPHCDGKQVIVELFEWRFADIANECERFLGDKDFCGVQVSPVTEHVAIFDRPWYERYQPVSYKIESRSGNETEFKDMVDRCKNVGIRIYVDVVLNHMAEPSMNNKGIAGSTFNSSSLEFPAVPYNRSHFNARTKCPTQDGKIHSYNQPDEIRNCHLDKLPDLDQSQSFVRSKIVNLLNHLIDLGVSGFRVDRAKFMHPEDILAIEKLTRNLTDGGKPFFFNHVQDYNQDSIKSSEYYQNGRVTEFQFGRKLAAGINNFALLNGLQYPSSGMADSDHAFVFVDNHDNQRSDISNILTHKTPREYKMANAFMLANDYGFTRVMSSYYFGDDTNLSPPQYTNNSMKDPITSIKQQGTCGHGWVCEHRWPSIANMVVFRNAVEGTWKTHWINKNNQLSFARGTKGFFAMAKNGKMNETLDTGLPAGEYCDLITDCKKTVIVEANGYALIEIDNADRPILAFIVDGPLAYPKTHFGLHTGNVIGNVIVGGSFSRRAVTDTTSRVVTMSSQATTPSTITTTITSSSVTTVRTTTSSPKCKDTKRTVIFFQEYTVSGQYLFIRGGIDDNHRAGCKNVPTASMSNCSIPISSHNVGSSVHYAAYNAWRQGDTLLDWQGPEPSQGKFQGKGAYGTPAVWTTNDPNDERYNHLNQFGQHYWLVDIDMDCCKTINGWFEVKAFMGYHDTGNWEGNIPQGYNQCNGTERTPSLDVLLFRNASAFLIDVKANNHQVTTDPNSSQQEQRIISFQRDMDLLKQEVEILKRSHQQYPSEEISQLKSVIMSLKETMHELKGEVKSLQVAKVDLIEEIKQVKKEMYSTGNKTAELEIKCAELQNDLSHLTTNKTKKLESSIDILKKSFSANMSLLNQKISHADAWLKVISFTTDSCCQNVKVLLNKTHLLTSLPPTTMRPPTTVTSKVNNAIIASSVFQLRTTIASKKCSDTRRTVIFIQQYAVSGQYLFIRGGIDERHRSGCKGVPVASMSNCSIPIQSHDLGSSGHFTAYNAWRKGDNFLDWHGPEPGQGTFQEKGAPGTPAVWTTNNPNDGRYNKLNTFGEHYWLVDIDMDCCKTINDWFEVKAFMDNHANNKNILDKGIWESNIFQGFSPCSGSERTPYESVNHWAKCGMMNVFHFNQKTCQIYPLN